jgi:predicted RNase H-like HicB family nuclease
MKYLKVIVCKANKGVSAHLPEVDGYVIVRDSIGELKKDLSEGIRFHIQGLYPEERREWMDGEYEFEFVFSDIPSFIEAHGDFINQSSLARIAGINEGLMRQYVSGVKHPSKKTMQRIEDGIKQYAGKLRSVSFDLV